MSFFRPRRAPTPASRATHVWLVGRVLKDYPEGAVWELRALQRTKARAEALCATVDDFIAPVEIGKPYIEGIVLPAISWPKK